MSELIDVVSNIRILREKKGYHKKCRKQRGFKRKLRCTQRSNAWLVTGILITNDRILMITRIIWNPHEV